MRRWLFVLGATLVAFAVVGAASARGPANEFAVGSAKSVEFGNGVEHASFSAHNTGVGCDATGQIVYKNTAIGVEFVAKVDTLVIQPAGPEQAAAFFTAVITKVKQGFQGFVGATAWFDAFDSGLGGPDGKGDMFRLRVIGLPPEETLIGTECVPPVPADPITQGNIVIKAEPLLR